MKKINVLMFLSGMIFSGCVSAETLLSYDPTGCYNNTDSIAVATVAPGLVASALSPSTAITTGSNCGVWPVEAVVAPFNAASYVSFVIQSEVPGRPFSLGSISWSARSYQNSSLTLYLRSSLDGFTTNIGSVSNVAGERFRPWQAVFDLTGLGVITGPVEFRFYTANAGPSSDWIDLASTAESDFGGATGLVVSGTLLADLSAYYLNGVDYTRGGFAVVTGVVDNLGLATSDSYQISFRRSSDSIISTADNEIVQFSHVPLIPGELFQFEHELTFPADPGGTTPYWGFCIINAGEEVSTTNNCSYAWQYPVSAPPAPSTCSVSPLSCGGMVSGSLDPGDCEKGPRFTPIGNSFSGTPYYLAESFEFSASAGQTVSISADWQNYSVDGYLYLEAPSGVIEALNDDYANSTETSRIENHVLQQSGTYTLWATTYRSFQSGNFVIDVTCDGVASPGTIAISPTAYNVSESAGFVSIDVFRTNGSDGAVSVNYSTANGTAAAPADYSDTPGSVNFADGETSRSIYIPIVDDAVYEASENFTLTISAPTGGASLGANTATVTILDNDPPPQAGTLSISPASIQVNENAGTASITVTRIAGSDGAVSVNYTTANGTAVAGSDYVTASGSINWADGDTGSKSVNIPIVDDAVFEANENFTLTISAPTGGASLGANTATVTILDNDPPPQAGTLSISPASIQVNENAGTVNLSVTRTNGSDGAVSVFYATSSETAVVGSDYALASGTLNWADGETGDKLVNVSIIDDAIFEANENFTVELGATTGGASLGARTATVTILDNDPPPQAGTLSISPASIQVNENAGTVNLSVTRTNGSAGAIAVNYTTTNGTAVAGSDYTTRSGSLNWADGDTSSKLVNIPIVDDVVFEPSENFTLTISVPTGGASLGTAIASVTISDNDPMEPVIVSIQAFNVSPSTISEGGTVLINWASQGANRCFGQDGVAAWQGEKPTTGNQSVVVGASGRNEFRLLCTNASNEQASAVAIVDVLGNNPDLDLESLTLSVSEATTNEQLSANAVFRNTGDGISATSTFRWYLSDNEAISNTDQLLATGTLASLAPGEAIAKSRTGTAPAVSGTYWVGICADPVAGEPDITNNCSTGVKLSVISNVSCNIGMIDCGAKYSASLGTTDCQSGPLGSGHFAAGRSFTGVAGQSFILDASWAGADGYLALQSPNGVIVSANDDFGDSTKSRIEYQLQQTGTFTAWLTTFETGTKPAFDLTLACPEQAQPNLSVTLIGGPPGELKVGDTFQAEFGINNIGAGNAGASTLRYLLSTNSTITGSDLQLGQSPVSSLSASANVTRNASLALSAPGDYWFGACVDTVEGETLTGNNCSKGQRVTVRSASNCTSSLLELGTGAVGTLGSSDCDKSPRGAAYYGESFNIDGNKGQIIGVTANWNGLDGYLYVEGPNGKVLAQNDDGLNSDESEVLVELPETGEYKVWATSYSPETGGAFELSAAEYLACKEALKAGSISADKNLVGNGEQVTVATQISYTSCGGEGGSQEALLRYFMSSNSKITSGDAEIGTDVIDSIQSGGSSIEHVLVEAPVTSGNYWIGACIGEIDEDCVVSEPIEVQSDIESIPFNSGLNDAWWNPAQPGQGMLITIFPATKLIFMAWFTFDTELPPEGAWSNLGDPGHRWMTAYGFYEGNSATLNIEMTKGGVFNSNIPQVQQSDEGTVQIQFTDCNKGTILYDIPSINQQGTVEIERVTRENLHLCEAALTDDQQLQSSISIEAIPPVLSTGGHTELAWQAPAGLNCVSTGGSGLWAEGLELEKSGTYKVRVGTEGTHNYGLECTSAIDLQKSVSANAQITAVSVENDGLERRGQKVLFNPGLNDAWFDPQTPGQGALLTIFPDTRLVFLAWFTFDTERPPANTPFNLGDPGHRWVTAYGFYDDDQAQLQIELTKGGVFDSSTPEVTQGSYGTMDLSFADCDSGEMAYNIPSLGLSGKIPLKRGAPDKIEECQAQDGFDDPIDVLDVPPPKETLPNSCGGSYTWIFEWEEIYGFDRYQIEIRNGRSDQPVYREIVQGTQLKIEKNEAITADYLLGWSWRVRAIDGAVLGPWSEEREFNVRSVSACN